MSHLTKVKTKLNNKQYLLKALDKMGFTYKTGENLSTKSRYGVNEKVEILITGNGKYTYHDNPIGFKKEADGTYTAAGDFYMLRDKDGNNVTAKSLGINATCLSKEAEVNQRLSNLRFHMDKQSRKREGNKLTFTMQRWVP